MHSSIVSPVIVGAQLSNTLCDVLISAIMLGEKISYKKWSLVFCSFCWNRNNMVMTLELKGDNF
jgi:hypothetical protein